MNNLPKTRDKNVLTQETGGELLLYDLKSNKALCLNESSAQIWYLCNGRNSCEEISRQTNIPKEFVWIAIENFNKNHLLEDSVQTELPADRVSRRKMLLKAGVTAVALPVVIGIIAPVPANAQSCLAPNSILLGGLLCGVPAAECAPTCNANAGSCCSMVGTTSLGCPDCFCICA